jgi:hypothetical protein
MTQQTRRKTLREKMYFGGLTLIIISFVACVISYWLLIFGIPAFLIGTILVLLSSRPTKTKLLATLTPIILYIPFTYLFLNAYNYTTPNIFLIPSDYEGTLRIIYEEECGQYISKKDGNEIFNFPSNGILILNEDFEGGINNKYFLVDKIGHKTEIPEILEFKNRKSKMPCVLVGGSGTMWEWEKIEVNSINKKEKGITYSDFYLINKNTTDGNEFENEQKFDSLTKNMVNQCRQKK